MPYARNEDLPPGIREHLPAHAQDIFRAAFNAAWRQHAEDPDVEGIAHRIAWAAVKHKYEKAGDRWVARGER